MIQLLANFTYSLLSKFLQKQIKKMENQDEKRI